MGARQRRAQYRVEVDGSSDLAVTVRGPRGAPAHGRMLDVSASGAGVTFDGPTKPSLAVGEVVELVFSSDELAEPLTIEARIQHRMEDKGVRRYGFEFLSTEDYASNLIPALGSLFNRRRARRVAPDEEERIEATMEAPDGDAAAIRLVDLSELGAGVSLEAELEHQFSDTTRVTLSLDLPGTSDVVEVVGDIRHRHLVGSRVAYGIEFDAERSEDFEQSRATIVEYVSRRLCDMLRSPEGGQRRSRPAA